MLNVQVRATLNTHSTIILAPRIIIEKLWSVHVDYYPSYSFPPDCEWFQYDGGRPDIFFAGSAHCDQRDRGHVLYFNDGRHRTRWLFNTQLDNIPLGIHPDRLSIFQDAGLVADILNKDDFLPLHWEDGYIDFSRQVK
jgi:hypothetical protein